METLDLLQEVIADYEGTVLIVSHDRDFLDRTVTITLGLDGSGKVDIVAGGYEDWQKRRAGRRPASSRAEGRGARRKPASASTRRDERQPKKLTYKDQRDYDLLPARIEELDAAIARDEALLSDHDLYLRDPAALRGADRGDRDGAGRARRGRASLAGAGRAGRGAGARSRLTRDRALRPQLVASGSGR